MRFVRGFIWFHRNYNFNGFSSFSGQIRPTPRLIKKPFEAILCVLNLCSQLLCSYDIREHTGQTHSKANITFHSKKKQHLNRVVEAVVLSFNFHLFENEKTIEKYKEVVAV